MLEDTTLFPCFANDLRTASQPHAKDPEAHLQPQLPGRRTSLKGTTRTQHPALPPSTSEQAPSSLLNPTSSWARPRTVPRQHCGGRQPARPPARRRLRALTAHPGPLEWPGGGRGPGRPPAKTAVQCVGRQARPGPARPQTGAQRPPQPQPGQALTCWRRRCHPGGVTGAEEGGGGRAGPDGTAPAVAVSLLLRAQQQPEVPGRKYGGPAGDRPRAAPL